MLIDVLSDFYPDKDTLTVLIVEDSEVQRMAIRYVLERDTGTKYELIETAYGEKAVELYHEHDIDCVILDYLLPDFDGLEFMNRVRLKDGFIERPIIFITAEGDRAIVAQAMEMGATDYIDKHRYEKDNLLSRRVQEAIEKKRYEHIRRESDVFLRSLVNTIPLPLYYKNRDLKFVMCNDAFVRFCGRKREEILGKTAREIFPGAYAGEYEVHDKKVLETQESQQYEMPLMNGSGILREVVIQKAVYRDTRGTVKGIMGVFTDVTDMKRSRDELLKSKVEAEFANKSKTQFLANMSHEIRTPLNGVIGMLKLLRSTPVNAEQHEYLDVAVSSAEGLLDVVDDVIDVTSIESGKIVLQPVEFDLNNLVRTVMDSFSGNENIEYLDLSYEIEKGTPQIINTDEGALRQILFNLVGNAVKYTRRGSIRLYVHPILHGSGGPRILFSVADTGPGIDEDSLRYIFQAYFQVGSKVDEQNYRRHIKGTGLGLSIVKRLVQMLGGTIAVETEPGAGTTMHFCIPIELSDGTAAKPRVKEPEEAKSVGSLHILVAEDNTVNQLVLCRTLEKLGHRPAVAADGFEVLEQMRDKVFDLVLMDIQMPEMDGIEATRRIRAGGGNWNRKIPIVAVTAHAMKGDRERLLGQGMDDYMAKPVDIENLQEVLERVMLKEKG
ncbi:hybrid sensor histidine kinase/response regulator [Oceanidesulfovibrio marinus]|uniref:histidine kinase n=1 Tax=Oceanidesulfovibrio marinus TaxID=370038 RepID=A0A6P1ZL53_9BACT|nr:hybrid sensor histidine kinase/response regulator [Oceanidesulfovibrio marinus]QJT10059.1 response regulator [Oceanidesulfovibrio marinus]TVM35824.1 hypothetical protein DQK91_03960 [Oceanidesulfovibrio marinus]